MNEAIRPQDRDIVQMRMRVQGILDLTQNQNQKEYGISEEQMTGNDVTDKERCREVADVARAEGYNAIRSVCAPAPEEVNLNIFESNIHGRVRAPDWIALGDVALREPLEDYWDE